MNVSDIRDLDRPAVSRGFRLQWEPAQAAHVLLYPEGMVKLNGSAGEILRRCNGVNSLSQIVEDLQSTFGRSDLRADVVAFLKLAEEKRWVEWRPRGRSDVSDEGDESDKGSGA